MAEPKKVTARRRSRRHSGSRKRQKMNAASLIKWLRKHSTWTLSVGVLCVSLLAGYLAIKIGA